MLRPKAGAIILLTQMQGVCMRRVQAIPLKHKTALAQRLSISESFYPCQVATIAAEFLSTGDVQETSASLQVTQNLETTAKCDD